MGPTSATTVRRLRLLAVSAALPLAGCSPFHHGFFAAAGPVADHERHLFVIVSIVMLFVIGPVLLLTPIFAWHYRLANTKSAYRPQWSFNWTLEGLIWIPPSVIVIVLAVFLWRDTGLKLRECKLEAARRHGKRAASFLGQVASAPVGNLVKLLGLSPDCLAAHAEKAVSQVGTATDPLIAFSFVLGRLRST